MQLKGPRNGARSPVEEEKGRVSAATGQMIPEEEEREAGPEDPGKGQFSKMSVIEEAKAEEVEDGSEQRKMECYEGGVEAAFHAQALMKLPAGGMSTPSRMDNAPAVLPPAARLSASGATDPEQLPAAGQDEGVAAVRGKKPGPLQGLEGRTLGELGPWLLQQLLECLPLRSKTTGRRSSVSIFPLPTSRSCFDDLGLSLSGDEVSWMLCTCLALNSLWGEELHYDGKLSGGQVQCLKMMYDDVKRLCSLQQVVPSLSWSDFFRVKSVDYKGDEVKVARWFTWSNISAALPGDVGMVPLAEVCTLGSRQYVEQFDMYLKDPSEWNVSQAPRVMVSDEDWPEVCKGLVEAGVCVFLEEADVFSTGAGPLLNGLFGVTKDEFSSDGTEIFRLIMNLIPLSGLCRPMTGDIGTLPSWSLMNPLYLQPTEELLISSEDVRCFFYTLSVPPCWYKYLAFNKLVPNEVLPDALQGRSVYLASRVLPMGFLNSVSLAQHVHRNLVQWSSLRSDGCNQASHELRKDKGYSVGTPTWRVYLDNYDSLERVEATQVVECREHTPAGILALRQEYEHWGIPRNAKKGVVRSSLTEMQGAMVDGQRGVAYPRDSKLVKYAGLALQLCQESFAGQRAWQVVCGGLVYFCMFRRPLLCSLNRVWSHIESYNSSRRHKQSTPADCKLEVLRFLGMLPLARLDFRLDMHGAVTCSDASTLGGGACVSTGLSALGGIVSAGKLRGEVPEACPEMSVLSIGLFDGIGALRVALDCLPVSVCGHISVESNPVAQRVVEGNFPGTVTVNSVEEITDDMVISWAGKFSQCSMVLIGAGPPCQGVSGLNASRKGALKDLRSSLFVHVRRVRDMVSRRFTWCPVHSIMESVSSMDVSDREVMSDSFGSDPYLCDAKHISWCNRPRLYWMTWELVAMDGVDIQHSGQVPVVVLSPRQPLEEVTKSGWQKVDQSSCYPTFTTSRPRERAGYKPAGVHQCTLEELQRWHEDAFRFPPYQYRTCHCLVSSSGSYRLPDCEEREVMLGFPVGYTANCMGKQQRKTVDFTDARLTLLGNSWCVQVVAVLLGQLFSHLGWFHFKGPCEVLRACKAGTHTLAQGRLLRRPLNLSHASSSVSPYVLACKLGNMLSLKGEDILLSTPTSGLVKFQRLRASVPGKLWRWRVIAGWRWRNTGDHINSLELRAILTTFKWRLEHCQHFNCRMIHLTDSLVCLHALARGRSSSRKLRRVLAKLNALVLVSNVQPVWGYIHTDDNPADKPSRWGQRVKSKFRHAKKPST
eukprot:Skav204023  [mRNA]  locus=scaffold229:88479:92291:+ [translate_table: standard]